MIGILRLILEAYSMAILLPQKNKHDVWIQ